MCFTFTVCSMCLTVCTYTFSGLRMGFVMSMRVLLPPPMQASCTSLQQNLAQTQQSLTQALEESEARKQHEQILMQQLNVRRGLLYELMCTVHACVCM